MDAIYYQKALKSKLLVLAGAAAIALGLCLAPRPVLASELQTPATASLGM